MGLTHHHRLRDRAELHKCSLQHLHLHKAEAASEMHAWASSFHPLASLSRLLAQPAVTGAPHSEDNPYTLTGNNARGADTVKPFCALPALPQTQQLCEPASESSSTGSDAACGARSAQPVPWSELRATDGLLRMIDASDSSLAHRIGHTGTQLAHP